MPTSALKERLPRMGDAAWIAINGAVFRSANAELTGFGRVVELGDRVLGPVFLGLVLLSIRNQVKR